MQGGSRIVIDVAKPVRIDKAFVLEAGDGQPARLVLDLAATDREASCARIALDNRAPDVGRKRTPPVAAAPAEAAIRGRWSCIDPGHGGIDNGTAAASGELEKAIVLEFALLLRDQLEKTGKYRVVMTRTDDTFIPLAERVRDGAQPAGALFISIHADALRARRGRGAGRDGLYAVGDAPPTPRPRGSPRARTGPT